MTGHTRLPMATRYDHATVVRFLTAGNGHVNRTAQMVPQHCMKLQRKGFAVCIQTSLQAGAGVSAGMQVRKDNDLTPLQRAVACNHAIAVLLLVAAGAEIISNATSWRLTPLQVAVHAGHVEVVQVLLEAGADAQHVDKLDCAALGSFPWKR